MNSRRIRQNVTYHCRNSHAVKNDKGKEMTFIKLQGDVDMTVKSHPKIRPRVIVDGCNVSIPANLKVFIHG